MYEEQRPLSLGHLLHLGGGGTDTAGWNNLFCLCEKIKQQSQQIKTNKQSKWHLHETKCKCAATQSSKLDLWQAWSFAKMQRRIELFIFAAGAGTYYYSRTLSVGAALFSILRIPQMSLNDWKYILKCIIKTYFNYL